MNSNFVFDKVIERGETLYTRLDVNRQVIVYTKKPLGDEMIPVCGIIHRLNDPAVIYKDTGSQYFWINGKKYEKNEFYILSKINKPDDVSTGCDLLNI
jgi:hypothetical protein